MLHLCIALLVIGIIALALEVLMPGYDSFIGGVVGVVSLVAAAVLGLLFVPNGWWFVAVSGTTILLCGAILLHYVRRGQLHGRIVLSDALAEDLPKVDYMSLFGKEGTATTKLRPCGEADFSGTIVEVTTPGLMLERGTKVKVTDVRANTVVVSPIHAN